MEVIGEEKLDKIIMTKGIAYVVHLCANTIDMHTPSLPDSLRILLGEFEDVFTVPKELPLQRTCDNHINLTDPNFTVNVRPYRYPFHQKNKIGKQISEML